MSESSGGGWLILGLFGLALYNCSGDDAGDGASSEYASGQDYTSSDGVSDELADEEEDRPDFDEDAARDAAEDELSLETYSTIGSPYGCTIDCSGHEAGYAWAADGNEDYGTSNSQSFDEGQQAYEEAVEERVQEMRDEYDAGEEPY